MSDQSTIRREPILKTQISVLTMERTVDYITENLDALRGQYVCVSNVHTTVMAFHDADYREIQNDAALNLPDGKPLSITQKKRGHKDAGRVAGPDLMPELFRISAKKGYRHYFYGAKQETLDQLKERLQRDYPGLCIAGMYSPPFRPLTEEEDREDVARIREAAPDFIWVGLGAPKQEKWMRSHKGIFSGLMIGVGAAFDFHAGTVKRAPSWMQEMCLEWLYRLIQDPVRLIPRYAKTNGSFLWYVHRETARKKKNHRQRAARNQRREHLRRKLEKKDSLKIAMLGHKRIPSREGGIEIVVEELSRRMVKLGHRVDAYNRRGSHVSGREFVNKIGKSYEGVRIITIPTFEAKSLNAIVYAFFATLRALFGEYDVIHFHAEGPCAMLPLARAFQKHTVATIHGLDWQRSKWGNFATRFLKYGERCAAKYADELIVLSKNVQTYFEQEYERESVYIPNGIHRPEYRAPEDIAKKWNLTKDSYILFLARIVPEKGAHYLIEAYERLCQEQALGVSFPAGQTDAESNRKANPQKKLVIAGGSSHSEEYFQKLKEKAKGNPNIIFTDFVGGRRLEELYSNAYLFVLPSDVEGMAISLLEAMSYGNCCLVSDIPENHEVVGDSAVMFRHSDTEDLMQKLDQLLRNPEAVQSYKDAAADYICTKFDWDHTVSATVAVYRSEDPAFPGEST